MIELLLQSMGEFPLEDLWSSTLGYTTIFVAVIGIIGALSGSMTIGAMSAYIAFVYIATTATGMPIVTNIVYVTLVVVSMGIGFKLYRMEGWG